ncbi:hypothetical protein K438DRAFT_1974663 [Mycena galopus ATCC 62051]|nr:hypothetical protein K438DRAFT_1974663 [Mycena galopus ATCC 62051]
MHLEKIVAIDSATDQAAADDAANEILTLDDIPEEVDESGDVTMTFAESDFERVEDDDAHRSAGEFAEVPKLKVATKRKKKAEKGEIRAAIEDLVKGKGKREGTKKAAVKKTLQNSDAAAASKKAGLSKSYLARSKGPQGADSPSKLEIGGLTDDDAISARPQFGKGSTTGQRTNNIVDDEDSSDADETPSRGPVPAAKPVPKRREPAAVKAEPKIPALTFVADNKTPRMSKRKGVKTEPSSGPFTPDVAAGLPAFIKPTWESDVLPAAYRALDCESDPLSFAAQGATKATEVAAVKEIQAIVDKAVPGNSFRVTWGDAICGTLVGQLREHRSRIVQSGVDVVDALYKTKEYLDQPTTIRGHVKYALRHDGPAFFKVPTPENCPPNPKLDGYIAPKGYLESDLIIRAVSPFLKKHNFTIPDQRPDGSYDFSGMPKGLFSLVAAPGVERGLRLYKATGIRESPPKFTKAAGGTAVAGYMISINRFTVSRWTSLFAAAGNTLVPSAAEVEDQDTLDGLWEYAYVPSSPS